MNNQNNFICLDPFKDCTDFPGYIQNQSAISYFDQELIKMQIKSVSIFVFVFVFHMHEIENLFCATIGKFRDQMGFCYLSIIATHHIRHIQYIIIIMYIHKCFYLFVKM